MAASGAVRREASNGQVHGRLWLVLFATILLGGFLTLTAAAPSDPVLRSTAPSRVWSDSLLLFVQPIAMPILRDNVLLDCLSLAIFGVVMLGASGLLRRVRTRGERREAATTTMEPCTLSTRQRPLGATR